MALVTGVDTTASLIGAKVRTALGANTALTALYTVGGTGANITLTRTVAANNDSTLNIAVAAGLGVSAITTSTNTTAGVGGVVLTNNTGDGKDFEGISLGSMSSFYGFLLKVVSGEVSFTHDVNFFSFSGIEVGGIVSVFRDVAFIGSGDFVITADGASEVHVTFIA